jgi:hypothetical protein
VTRQHVRDASAPFHYALASYGSARPLNCGVSGDKMKRIGAMVSLVLPSLALAGGDYVSGTVSAFSRKDGIFSFTFVAARTLVGLEQCQSLRVSVEYGRVPWYSWLPFVDSGHPTKAQTESAASLLQAAHRTSQPILFGYLGHGLVPSSAPCTFKSKGLAIESDRGRQFVLSYHDQT